MKNRFVSISIVMLLFFGVFACLTGMVSASPDLICTTPSPVNGTTDVVPSASLSLQVQFNNTHGYPSYSRFWTNATGSYVYSNRAGPFYNTTLNWNMDASSYLTKYWWGVVVNDSGGASTYNYSFDFTTVKDTVITVTNPNPANASTGAPLDVVFSVLINDTIGNTGYIWNMQCQPFGTNGGGSAANGTQTLSMNGLSYNSTYKMWVNVSDGVESAVYWYTFKTMPIPLHVFITYPVNGSTLSSFVHVTGTCTDPNSSLYLLLVNDTGMMAWNFTSHHWQAGVNSVVPVGVASWSVSSNLPALKAGVRYGVMCVANRGLDTNASLSYFYAYSHPSQQVGAMGLIAKLIIELVLVFIALGLIYMVVQNYLHKKHSSLKDTLDLFTTLFIGLICIGIAAVLVAIF